jgi:sulfate/thiosulfate transport system substrate-binding protein
MRRIWLSFLPALVLAAGIVVGAKAATTGTTLSLVAYSTPKDAYAKIIPAFQSTAAGKGVSFNQSYGASGDQARAVAAGLSADIVALSLAPDVTALVKKGLVPSNWNQNAYHGMVTDSVVVFVVRNGNPKNIHTWADLAKSGVQVITPNPFTSGGARWNVMAAYGAERAQGKTDSQAIDYLKKLFKNVSVLPKSAREATQVFASGKGDVLLTYENEAIYANKKGVHTEYVLPKQTILVEKLFGDTGYRPVLKSVYNRGKYRFKQPKTLFTINSKALGLRGWKAVQYRFFDHNSGVMTKIIGH